jgi:hypothetical protein
MKDAYLPENTCNFVGCIRHRPAIGNVHLNAVDCRRTGQRFIQVVPPISSCSSCRGAAEVTKKIEEN